MSTWVPNAGPPVMIDAMLPHSLHEPQLSVAHVMFLEEALDKRRDDARTFGAWVAPATDATGFRTAGLSIVTAPAASVAPTPIALGHPAPAGLPLSNDEYGHQFSPTPTAHQNQLSHGLDQTSEPHQEGNLWNNMPTQSSPDMNQTSQRVNIDGFADPSDVGIHRSAHPHAHVHAHEMSSPTNNVGSPGSIGRHMVSGHPAIHRDAEHEETDEDNVDVSDGDSGENEEEGYDEDVDNDEDGGDDDQVEEEDDDEDEEEDEDDEDDEDDDANLTEFL